MTEVTYDKKWFEERARTSITKIMDNTWDFSDSLLLYTSTGVEVYESMQEIDTPYFRLVTRPEREYLLSIADTLAELLPDNFEYIDLGPGTERKEQFLFDALKLRNKKFTYIPVDISDRFLDIAETHATKQNISVKKIKSSFEELPLTLQETALPRFVSLGLTFSNYHPQTIINLLEDIAGNNGYIFINSQMRDRVDMVALQKVYQDDAQHLVDDKVRLIGLNPDTDVTPRTADDGFKIWCTVINNNTILENLGVETGDSLLVFQSLRYTKESLESELKKSSSQYQLLDTGSPFIASIIRT